MRLRGSLFLLVLFGTDCKRESAEGKIGDGPGTVPIVDPNTPTAISTPDRSFTLLIPGRWDNAYRVDTLTTVERGMARPGAINIVYLPQDTTVIPQTLVVVAVYDSLAWIRVKGEGGPPPGDSVFAKDGRVYVLGLPQSNPFAPGSSDALKFDSLALTGAEKARMISVP